MTDTLKPALVPITPVPDAPTIDTRMWRVGNTIQANLNETLTVQCRVYKRYNGEITTSITGWQVDNEKCMTHVVNRDFSKHTDLGVSRLTKKLVNTEIEKFITDWPSIRKEVMAFYKIES